ncbi:DUF4136 domain-containing protein [Paraburkholderia dinghuensis]|uniref:DUF4136 domain-containing protein n=1 Tax=Paraburkholderia dinghuensis TaxID=2305225 RepID=UPI00162909A1|nr:DUF4136 domain-containing protein [Paraburkholderia dinghuensis]
MNFPLTICAVLMLGALAGCAGVTADVNARGDLPEPAQGTVNYRFAQSPVQVEKGASSPAESMLRDGLAKRGFVEGKPDTARYLVSVAWATRPAGVTVAASGDCAEGCAPAGQPLFPWFGHPYVHTLTLRFFALPQGTEAYRVSVEKRDRNGDAEQALPYLVAGALARLPYAGAPQWRVQLREPGAAGDAAARAMPEVVSVKPVPQPQ